MLTWQVDRFLRAGPLCALATLVIPVMLAFAVDRVSAVENVLGVVLVASGLMFLGTVFGSVLTTGAGAALFGVGTIVAEVSAPWLLAVGVVLLATIVLHDLAGAFRRGPRIHRGLWRDATITVVVVGAVSAASFALASLVGGLARWHSIVVPFGIAAVGFAAKLAADSHARVARQLTRKRTSEL